MSPPITSRRPVAPPRTAPVAPPPIAPLRAEAPDTSPVDTYEGADPTRRAHEPAAIAEPGGVAASRLAGTSAFARLSAPVQERVRELEATGTPAATRNLTTVIGARRFSDLAPERQLEVLAVHTRHPEDSRVTGELARLPASRVFRDDDPAAQSAAISEAGIPARLRSDALRIRNTTTPEHIEVNGVGLDVYGASPRELDIIEHTLSALPASHLRTLPEIVVGERIGHGNNSRGGAFVSARDIAAYERGSSGGRNAAAYRAEGWVNPPRLELTHESLGREDVVRNRVSPTVLHETGHAVDEAYHLSHGLTDASLGAIDYDGGRYAGPALLGPTNERFADGYMRYYLGFVAQRRDRLRDGLAGHRLSAGGLINARDDATARRGH